MAQVEDLLNNIKLQGFERLKQQMNSKLQMKDALQVKVNRLEAELRRANRFKKDNLVEARKIEFENNSLYSTAYKNKREVFFMAKEVPDLRGELDEVID